MSINWKGKTGYFGNGIQTDTITALTSAGVELNNNLEITNDLTVNNDTIILGTTNFGDDVNVDNGVTMFVDTLSEQTLNNGVQIVGGVNFTTDYIKETTTNAGVEIEQITIEDGTLLWSGTGFTANQTAFPGGYKYEEFSSTTTTSTSASGNTCTIYFLRLGEMVFADIRYTHNSAAGTYIDLDTAIPTVFRPTVSFASRVGMISSSSNSDWVYCTIDNFGILRLGRVNSGFSLISIGTSISLSCQIQYRGTNSWV